MRTALDVIADMDDAEATEREAKRDPVTRPCKVLPISNTAETRAAAMEAIDQVADRIKENGILLRVARLRLAVATYEMAACLAVAVSRGGTAITHPDGRVWRNRDTPDSIRAIVVAETWVSAGMVPSPFTPVPPADYRSAPGSCKSQPPLSETDAAAADAAAAAAGIGPLSGLRIRDRIRDCDDDRK